MDAVNLIPGDARKRQVGVSASPLTLGLIGVLVAAIVCAGLYVFALNHVRAKKSELARVTATASSWQTAANSYAALITAAQQRSQQVVAVRQLVTGRFPWSQLLSQIGQLMPANAALSSLQAITPTATAPSTGAAATATSPTVTLAACAASQSGVAQAMVQLHQATGVTSVQLSSSTDTASGSSSSSSGSSGSSGGCPFPVQFNVTLTLASGGTAATATSTSAATSGASTTSAATSAASTTTTPATATPAATTTSAATTPAATATPTTTTGAAQ
jgi:Tfp pilus assembly protein PilN